MWAPRLQEKEQIYKTYKKFGLEILQNESHWNYLLTRIISGIQKRARNLLLFEYLSRKVLKNPRDGLWRIEGSDRQSSTNNFSWSSLTASMEDCFCLALPVLCWFGACRNKALEIFASGTKLSEGETKVSSTSSHVLSTCWAQNRHILIQKLSNNKISSRKSRVGQR